MTQQNSPKSVPSRDSERAIADENSHHDARPQRKKTVSANVVHIDARQPDGSSSAHVPPVAKLPKQIERLLMFEAQLRTIESLAELKFFVANETAPMVSANQVFILSPKDARGKRKLQVGSSITNLDRNAPFVSWLEQELRNKAAARTKIDGHDASEIMQFQIQTALAPVSAYPYFNVLYVPIVRGKPNGKPVDLGAIAFLSADVFLEKDEIVARRLQDAVSHSWFSFGNTQIHRARQYARPFALLACVLLLVSGFIPVPLSALAPVEIVAKNPALVTAPINGVIEAIYVDPGQRVKKGDVLASYDKAELANELAVLRQKTLVAAARFNKVQQQAFGSSEGRRELAISKIQLELAKAEQAYAQSRLEKSDIVAQRGGVALFSERDRWTGKPVSTGERIIRIAEPDNVHFQIELPVSDAIVLEKDASVRVFLDADPLNSIMASVRRYNVKAEVSARDILSYRIYAEVNESGEQSAVLDIGMRGTAQVLSDEVPLAFFLFRKPIAAIRQYFGV